MDSTLSIFPFARTISFSNGPAHNYKKNMLKASSAWPTYDIIELAYKPDVKYCSRKEKSVKGTFPMSTQEERLETVEFNLRQFKTETIKVYQDMAFEMTMIKGLTEDTIKRLAKLSDTMEKRFERVDTRLDRVESMTEDTIKRLAKLSDTVEKRFERVDTRLDRVESMTEDTIKRLAKLSDTVEKRFERVDTRLDRVESMLAQILARLPEKP